MGRIPIGSGLRLSGSLRRAVQLYGAPLRLDALGLLMLDQHRADQPVGWVERVSILNDRVMLFGHTDPDCASQTVSRIRADVSRVDPGVLRGQAKPKIWTVDDLLDAPEVSAAISGLPRSRWRS